jgi:hypothetical protein
MKMRPHRTDWHRQHRRNLLVRALFLMVEHQHGPLDRAQLPQRPLHAICKFTLQEQLLCIT